MLKAFFESEYLALDIYIYRLLTVYRKIFGTSSYGEGRVHLRHMNEFRIFLQYTVNNLYIIYP